MTQQQDMSCDKYRNLSSQTPCLSQIMPTGGCAGMQKLDNFCCVNNFNATICQRNCDNDFAGDPTKFLNLLQHPQWWGNCYKYYVIYQYLASSDRNGVKFVETVEPQIDSETTLLQITDCYADLCRGSKSCSSNETAREVCTIDNAAFNRSLITPPTSNALVECKQALCPPLTINQDIAGIGVFISYIIQVSLVVVIALIRLYLIFPKRRPSHQSSLSDRSRLNATSGHFQEFAGNFHKAQCFFAWAISISTLYSIRRNDNDFSYVDRQALKIIAGNGIWPVCIMLLTLFIGAPKQKISRLIFSLSVLTWFMSFLVAEVFLLGEKYDGASGKCDNGSIPKLCNISHSWLGSGHIYFLSIFLMLGCVIPMIMASNLASPLRAKLVSNLDRSPQSYRICRYILLVLIMLFSIGNLIIWVLALIALWKDVRKEWAFGQVVALLIWAPLCYDAMQLGGKKISKSRQYKDFTTRITQNDAMEDNSVLLSDLENAKHSTDTLTSALPERRQTAP